MDLYQLKTFFTLARIKNFTHAAQALYVTQSAVSHAIKKLEQSVDTVLIERKGKQLRLTEAGQRLFRSCEIIFYELDKAAQDIAHFKAKALYRIRIGSTVEFGNSILIRHIRPFMQAHPDIHLDFLFSHTLLEPLLRDEVDIIIDCKPHLQSGLEKIPLFTEKYITIASPGYVTQHSISTVSDLEHAHVLSLDKEMAWWNNFFSAVTTGRPLQFKHVIRINHIRGMINAAISGLGIGFVPTYTVIREMEERTLIDPFPQITPVADTFCIYIKKGKLKFEKHQLIIDYLRRFKPEEFGAV